MGRLFETRGTDSFQEERLTEMTGKQFQEASKLGTLGTGSREGIVRGLSEMRSWGTNQEKGYNTWWDCRPMIEE